MERSCKAIVDSLLSGKNKSRKDKFRFKKSLSEFPGIPFTEENEEVILRLADRESFLTRMNNKLKDPSDYFEQVLATHVLTRLVLSKTNRTVVIRLCPEVCVFIVLYLFAVPPFPYRLLFASHLRRSRLGANHFPAPGARLAVLSLVVTPFFFLDISSPPSCLFVCVLFLVQPTDRCKRCESPRQDRERRIKRERSPQSASLFLWRRSCRGGDRCCQTRLFPSHSE